jgi:hypothetical protein
MPAPAARFAPLIPTPLLNNLPQVRALDLMLAVAIPRGQVAQPANYR